MIDISDLMAIAEVGEHAVLAQSLRALCRLGVPDAIPPEGVGVNALAYATRCDQQALRRVLRFLSAHGFASVANDSVALTPKGRLLRSDVDGSVAATLSGIGSGDVMHALDRAIRTGGSAFAAVYGEEFWPHLARTPEAEAEFAARMESQGARLNLPLASLITVEGTVADLGGGTGQLLAEVLRHNPDATGILVERAEVAERARAALSASNVAGRCTVTDGDLFAPPPAADHYLLARILHDWSDADAHRILRALRKGAPTGAGLWILELMIADEPNPGLAAMSDITMLALFGQARERTEDEFRGLLDATGWRTVVVTRTPFQTALIRAVASSRRGGRTSRIDV